VTTVDGGFRESGAEPVIRSVPLSHVSVELGHLYPEDLADGPARLRTMFTDTVPWLVAASQTAAVPGKRSRISTCFLVDDYFGQLPSPVELIPDLLAAAANAGVTIDYLAREASCATPGPGSRTPPAALLAALIVEEPAPGCIGARPSAADSGWLCNGVRSPDLAAGEAMELAPIWAPPQQNAARRHSIFVDVQLWDDAGVSRTWSCPMLAATWQAIRLGLLRLNGAPVVDAQLPPTSWPHRWDQLPAVMRLNEGADPFCAYRTMSVLSPRFLPVEVAVRTILGQVHYDPGVLEQITARAKGEDLHLPIEVLDRVHYAFTSSSETDPA
jgi:hypothetical protein